MSCVGLDFSTPIKDQNPFEELCPKGSRKRKQVDFSSEEIISGIESQHASASPHFKRSKEFSMPACRSPNRPPLTQAAKSNPQSGATPAAADPPVEQDTDITPASLAAPAMINPDFLMNLDKKLDLLTSGMMSISAKVHGNSAAIAANTSELSKQSSTVAANSRDIADIYKKLEMLSLLQSGPPQPTPSPDYGQARRLLRFWPIEGSSLEDLCGGVGDFLHDKLGLLDTEMKQTDIVAIERVNDPVLSGTVRQEVLVTFNSPDLRDAAMMKAANLANEVDLAGLPFLVWCEAQGEAQSRHEEAHQIR